MGKIGERDWDEEYSVISEKPELGFLDYKDDESLHSLDPLEGGPIVVTIPFPFVNGKPQSALIGETSAASINITNSTNDPAQIWNIKIYSSNPEDSFILSLMQPPLCNADEESVRSFVGLTYLEDRVLQPGQTLTIWLSCRPKVIGLHTTAVHFDIEDERIERRAFLLADDEISKSLFSTKPYSRSSTRTKRFNHDQYVAGSRPSRTSTQGFRCKLPQFDIPQDIREIVENKDIPDVIKEGLDSKNYAKFFSNLIALEEIHLEEEMRAHNMECVTMKKRPNLFLSLEVPGLAERRPSLVYGDYIFVQLASENPDSYNHTYQGYIHRVEADEIYLRFDKNFHLRHRNNNLYNVSFTYNRVNMRRLYQAVHAAENLGADLLFPSLSSHKRVIKTSPFKPLNPYLNREQTRSVQKILGCIGSPPYIIYGPPGTGKTMTLVEAILQLCKTRRKACVLVCASSNSAADHVLEKLLDSDGLVVKNNEIFRLNATSRPYEDVKPEFVQFCFFDEEMIFKCPPLKALLRYKIIISTYMSASLLYAEGIRRGHFSHIFLDEAGQASEPETMVPISNLCKRDTVIILAGDPMQLGPVIYSRVAETYGLGKSFLDRLFECEHYGNGDENYVIKLVRNYRCHPAILELPSQLFYNGQLIACKEELESSSYDHIDLPNKSFPVLFIGIQGCDEREGNNPSWFNRIEASKVVDIIRKLKRNTDMSDADIGVITPYRQQVLKLKKAFESLEMPDLKVGSVEQFQGQEREVIIISTVRSTVKHEKFDRLHNLGFLSNPRRFNVAITRAKSLLIIVGNPHIICKDQHWDKLLRYCTDNGSYQGCSLPAPDNHYCSEDKVTELDGRQEILQRYFKDDDQWSEDKPFQYSDKLEYSILPNQYQNDTECGGHISKTCSEVEWGDTSKPTMEQDHETCNKDVKWGDYPEDETIGYDGEHDIRQPHFKNDDQSGEGKSTQYSNKVKSGDTPNQYFNDSDKVELGAMANQCQNDTYFDNDISNTYNNEITWNGIPIVASGWGSDDAE